MKSELLKKLESVRSDSIIGRGIKHAIKSNNLEEHAKELKECHWANAKLMDEVLGFSLLKF
jgi:hypothetical protein